VAKQVKPTKVKKKTVRRNVTVVIAHIKATFNNTTVTITDTKGDMPHSKLLKRPRNSA
jgi:ribosomal protein S11